MMGAIDSDLTDLEGRVGQELAVRRPKTLTEKYILES
jgi:hypothetical protein